jgi:hypothetical protein
MRSARRFRRIRNEFPRPGRESGPAWSSGQRRNKWPCLLVRITMRLTPRSPPCARD